MAEYLPAGIYYPPAPGESPRGIAPPPGIAHDDGSRDPSSTTAGGAVAAAYGQMAEMQSDAVSPAGTWIGDLIDLPPKGY